MWAATTAGTLAVVDIKPGENGQPLMVAKAELNTDRAAHSSGITRVAEVLCTPAGTSVLITGDAVGTLAVRYSPSVLQPGLPPTCEAMLHTCDWEGSVYSTVCVSEFRSRVHNDSRETYSTMRALQLRSRELP